MTCVYMYVKNIHISKTHPTNLYSLFILYRSRYICMYIVYIQNKNNSVCYAWYYVYIQKHYSWNFDTNKIHTTHIQNVLVQCIPIYIVLIGLICWNPDKLQIREKYFLKSFICAYSVKVLHDSIFGNIKYILKCGRQTLNLLRDFL